MTAFVALQNRLMRRPEAGEPPKGARGNDQGGIGSEENGMRKIVKATPKHAVRRDLFGELSVGVAALAEARQGRRALRTHALEYKPAPKVTPKSCRVGRGRAFGACQPRGLSRRLQREEVPTARAVPALELVHLLEAQRVDELVEEPDAAVQEQNPNHPGLRFKRVHSSDPVYSVRVGIGYRAVGVLEDDIMIWFWRTNTNCWIEGDR
jgi:hypothetical protein